MRRPLLPTVESALAKETNKAREAGAHRGARRHPAVQVRRHRGRQARSGRHHQGARRSGSDGAADRPRQRPAAAGRQGGRGRDRLDPEQSRAVVDGAERLVRPVARLGAAARRDRACHHLRRDGRHQHGPWRDGDARRLHHLRGAGGDPHPLSRACSTIRCSSRCRSPSSSPARSAC